MSLEGWGSIDFNWSSESAAYFYGCRSGAGDPSFTTKVSGLDNFGHVEVHGQASFAYPSNSPILRRSTNEIKHSSFSYPTYLVGSRRFCIKAKFMPVRAIPMTTSYYGIQISTNYFQKWVIIITFRLINRMIFAASLFCDSNNLNMKTIRKISTFKKTALIIISFIIYCCIMSINIDHKTWKMTGYIWLNMNTIPDMITISENCRYDNIGPIITKNGNAVGIVIFHTKEHLLLFSLRGFASYMTI